MAACELIRLKLGESVTHVRAAAVGGGGDGPLSLARLLPVGLTNADGRGDAVRTARPLTLPTGSAFTPLRDFDD
jgi:hypothetical protein